MSIQPVNQNYDHIESGATSPPKNSKLEELRAKIKGYFEKLAYSH